MESRIMLVGTLFLTVTFPVRGRSSIKTALPERRQERG